MTSPDTFFSSDMLTQLLSLKGKRVLVTGASRGIGAAIALQFAAAGADVAVNHSKEKGPGKKKADSVVDKISGLGVRAVALNGDISQKKQVTELVEKTVEALGGLDILVLNAAKAPFKPLEKLFERELRQLVETNYFGHLFCVQEALPHLTEKNGHILFISSLGSRFYNPAYPLGSMKAAMEAVVRDLSESLSDRAVKVNGICGGIVRTDSFKTLRLYMEGVAHLPASLLVTPQEMAAAALFLVSPLAMGISGQNIVVDKGLSNSLYRTWAMPSTT